MSKKNRILLMVFVTASACVFMGTIMKLLHLPGANMMIGIGMLVGLLIGFVFLYLLISHLVK